MALAPAPCYISPASYYSPPIAPIHSKEKKMKKCRRRRSRRNEKNSPNTIAEVETRETEEPEPALGLFYRICSSLGLFHRISSPKEKFEEEMKKQPAPRRRHSNERNRTKMSGCETSAEEEAGETEEQEPDLGLFHRISSHLIRWLIPFPNYSPPISPFPIPSKEKFEEEMKKQPAPRRRHSNERNRTKMSGCEASAEEEAGETEEPEPVNEVAVYSLQAPEPRNRVFKIFLSPHTGPQHSA